ncbi:H(+)-transporting V1 sector ATPase subunit F [Saxophila tyrrhenica]|uniref:V-type proton ATPase subunit F n=1 Tax=Saxophila tyrrhenica TaxID=1690608 RepID=A0AAV9P7E9_9PEZI|nr:H(+)-transporting V1 sector ATPase subunit F [Saxophila tyrrhenica]
MALPQSAYKDREFLAVIGDEHVTDPPDSQKNYLVVDSKTETSTIEGAFESFTRERKDIAIVLINQHIAEKIRAKVDQYNEAFPALLEIPSKDHPYDPEKDSVMKRVRKLFGE